MHFYRKYIFARTAGFRSAVTYSTAKVGIKMHALSLCFISAACFSASIAVPTNAKNFNFFSHLCSLYSKTEIAAHTVNLKYNGSQHVYGQEYIILYGGTYNYYVL